MYQFIESICFINGEAQLLSLHQQRVNRTFDANYSGIAPIVLEQVLSNPPEGKLIKCRILYNATTWNVEFHDYKLPRINSLQVVEGGNIDYEFKLLDRLTLSQLFEKRGECDDVLIVKNKKITDSYFANCAFFDGEEWVTPNRPLLFGVKREKLIGKGVIKPMDISVGDIPNFEKVSLINAILDLHDVEVLIKHIRL